MKQLKIIQPGRIGDIIIVLPIAKYYYDLGFNIYWPVMQNYIQLFDDIEYVNPQNIGGLQGAYQRSLKFMPDIKTIDLGIGFTGHPKLQTWKRDGLSFDEWKYKEAKVPLSEKYKLQIKRNKKREQALIDYLKLDINSKYVAVHDKGSHGRYHLFRLATAKDNAIFIDDLPGFFLFDWIEILEKAYRIFCVDSCVANLVNQLGLAKGRRYFHPWGNEYYTDLEQQILTPKMADGWEVI